MAYTEALRAFAFTSIRVRLSSTALLQSRIQNVQGLHFKESQNPTKSYVGMTIQDVNNRLEEHNKGLSKYTKTYKPWELVYFETFYCKLCADKREQFLKSGFGYKFRSFVINYYSKLGTKNSSLKNGE